MSVAQLELRVIDFNSYLTMDVSGAYTRHVLLYELKKATK